MSQRSAQVYETSTETLFVGRQDAMQRLTLLPVAEFMEGELSKKSTVQCHMHFQLQSLPGMRLQTASLGL